MKKQLLLLAVLAAAAVSCREHSAQSASGAPSVAAITIDSAMTCGLSREFVGVVEDAYTTMLSFAVPGNIRRILVSEGDAVREGDVVAELDERTARNAWNAAKASLDRAEDGYSRAKQVYDKGSLPEVKWVEICSQLEQARSLFDIASKNLEDCRLVSPVSGTVSSVEARQGMNVAAYAPVMSLMSSDGLRLRIKVPESEISSLAKGDGAVFSVPAVSDGEYPAQVESKGVSADPVSHSYKLYLAPLSGTEGLLPGMVCRVRFSSSAGTGYSIPGRAVQLTNDGRHYVWTVREGRVMRRIVSVGGIGKDGVVISDGLAIGDVVVTDGVFRISEGMKVVVK